MLHKELRLYNIIDMVLEQKIYTQLINIKKLNIQKIELYLSASFIIFKNESIKGFKKPLIIPTMTYSNTLYF